MQLLVPGRPRAGQEGLDNGIKVSLYSYKVYIISGGLSVYVFRVDKDTTVYMYSFNHTLHDEIAD